MKATELERSLGYHFTNKAHLELALTHSSYASEHSGREDNERLEFLGDAVLGLAVTDFLFTTYPDLREGEMAKARAASVDRDALALVADRIGLDNHLKLSHGEESTGGRAKPSILADTMEAILGAVYLDAGYETTAPMILGHWEEIIIQKATSPGSLDFKTRLQEILATRGKLPEYVVTGSGPDHARRFEAGVVVEGRPVGSGRGKSKKEAEQQAARAAIEVLSKDSSR